MNKAGESKRKTPLVKKRKHSLLWATLIIGAIAATGVLIVRLSQASTGGDLADNLKNEYRKNVTKPIGQLSSVTSCKLDQNTGIKSGAALGWAVNRAQPSSAAAVELVIDGNKHSITTNKPTPSDVRARYPNIGTNNGFEFAIPQEYYDNKQHTVEGFVIGNSRENIGKISFTCTVVAKNSTNTSPEPETNTTVGNNSGGSENNYDSNSLAAQQVVESITSPYTTSSASSGSSQSSGTSTTNLSTVNLLDPSKKYSQDQIDEINKQINNIPSDKLKTFSNQVQLVPNLLAINKDVKSAQYALNQELVYSTNKEPFNYNLDTTRFANGSYRLDVVGNNAKNEPIIHLVQKFNIQNNLSFLARLRNIITYPWYWLFDLQS